MDTDDQDENIRKNSMYKIMHHSIWNDRKTLFFHLNRHSNSPSMKTKRGYLITNDDAIYVVGDTINGLLEPGNHEMDSEGYKQSSGLSHWGIEDIQVGDSIAAARTSSGRLIVWGPGFHHIIEATINYRSDLEGLNTNQQRAVVIHHYCAKNFVMAVTSEGMLVYWKPRQNPLSSNDPPIVLRQLWPNMKLPPFQWCGGTHGAAFGLTESGKVYSWGQNKYAELGRFTASESDDRESEPQLVKIPPGLSVAKVVCGQYHAAALTTCGQLYVWGTNICGVFGDGTSVPKQAYVPQPVSCLRYPVTAVATSKVRPVIVCRLSNNKVYAWGALQRRVQTADIPYRTSFRHVPEALVHFGLEFQMFWGSRTGSGHQAETEVLRQPPTPVSATPLYDAARSPFPDDSISSDPDFIPATPSYTPITPRYESETSEVRPICYGPQAPEVGVMPNLARYDTSAAAPPPVYSDHCDHIRTVDYHHGSDPVAPSLGQTSTTSNLNSEWYHRQPASTPAPVVRTPVMHRRLPTAVSTCTPRPDANVNLRKRPSYHDIHDRSWNSFGSVETRRLPAGSNQPQAISTIVLQPPPHKMSRFSTTTEASSSYLFSAPDSNQNANFPARTNWLQPESITNTFTVPGIAVGSVIGQGGATIKYLAKLTGARIQVLGRKGDYRQQVQISGRTAEIVEKAFQEIQRIIHPYLQPTWNQRANSRRSN